MSRVRDWFDEFAMTLIARSNRPNWPSFDSEVGQAFWDDFERSLIRIGATFALADEASSIVCDMPDLFPADIRPKVIDEVKKLRAKADMEAKGSDPNSSVEAARTASRDCPDCLGNGSAVRYVHAEILGKLRTAAGNPVPVGGSVSIPCSCPLGLHVARGLAPECRPAPPTIDKYPSLRRWAAPWGSPSPDGMDNQFRYRPSEWDADRGCPVLGDVRDLATLKSAIASRKASGVPDARRSQLASMDRASRPEVTPQAKPEPRSISIPEDHALDGWF